MTKDDQGPGEEDLAIPQQDAIWVYQNPRGGIVLKQSSPQDEDTFVYFDDRHAETICESIMKVAREVRASRAA